jgi:hypothetical protein
MSLDGTSFILTSSADGTVKLSYLEKRLKFSLILYSWDFVEDEPTESPNHLKHHILQLKLGKKSSSKLKHSLMKQSGSEFQLFPKEICVQCVSSKKIQSESFIVATGCNSGYVVVSKLPSSYLKAQIQAEKKAKKK